MTQQQSGDKPDKAIREWESRQLSNRQLKRYPDGLVINVFDDHFVAQTKAASIFHEETIPIFSDREVIVRFYACGMYSETDDRTLRQIVVARYNPLMGARDIARQRGEIVNIDPEFLKQRWWPYESTRVSGITGNDVKLALDSGMEIIKLEMLEPYKEKVLKEVLAWLKHAKASGGRPTVAPPWVLKKKEGIIVPGFGDNV